MKLKFFLASSIVMTLSGCMSYVEPTGQVDTAELRYKFKTYSDRNREGSINYYVANGTDCKDLQNAKLIIGNRVPELKIEKVKLLANNPIYIVAENNHTMNLYTGYGTITTGTICSIGISFVPHTNSNYFIEHMTSSDGCTVFVVDETKAPLDLKFFDVPKNCGH